MPTTSGSCPMTRHQRIFVEEVDTMNGINIDIHDNVDREVHIISNNNNDNDDDDDDNDMLAAEGINLDDEDNNSVLDKDLHDNEDGMPAAVIADASVRAQKNKEYIKENMHAQGTRKLYDGYMRRMRKWVNVQPDACGFKDGLDKLGKNSEALCCAWMSEQVHEKKIGSRAIAGMHAALKWHFVYELECDSVPTLGWKMVNGVWIGNPVFSREYTKLKKSQGRKEKRSMYSAKHSPSLLFRELKVYLKDIVDALAKFAPQPDVITAERTQLELMHCFMVFAYRMWARCDEVCSLRWRDVNPIIQYAEPGHHPYLECTLTFRKTNQYDHHKSHVYELYELKGQGEVDAIKAYQRWKAYWELVLFPRKALPNDLIFPTPDKKSGYLLLKARKMDASQINLLLRWVQEISSLPKELRQKITSHCFRRGGAQDAVLHAKKYGGVNISLHAAIWWGGWSKGERVNMLAHYLLDEVAKHEEYHGDMQQPGGNNNRTQLLAGSNTTQEVQLLEGIQNALGMLGKQLADGQQQAQQHSQNLIQSFRETMQQMQGLHATSSDAQATASNRATAIYQETERRLIELGGTVTAVNLGAGLASAMSSLTPRNVNGKPMTLHIPSVKTMQDVIDQWEKGDDKTGLLKLKEWGHKMRSNLPKATAQTFSQRKKLYKAYADCGCILEAFEERFGGAGLTLREYSRAITAQKRETAPASTFLMSATSLASPM